MHKSKINFCFTVSQFTLYSVLKGNKPDFHNAMGSETSLDYFNNFVSLVKDLYDPELIKEGKFGAYMNVSLNNDGPITVNMDSRKFTYTN